MNALIKKRITRTLYDKGILQNCPICDNQQDNITFHILGFASINISYVISLKDVTPAKVLLVACSRCGSIQSFLTSVLDLKGIDEPINPYAYIQQLIRYNDMSTIEFQNNIQESSEFVENLLNGKLRLSEQLANKIEALFNINAGYLLELQQEYYND